MARRPIRFYVAQVLIMLLLVSHSQSPLVADEPLPQNVDFNRDIRPILSDNCFHCHGPDANKRKADLRLDIEEGLHTDLGRGKRPAVAGRPEASEIVRRVTSVDPDELMPPPETGKSLSPRDIAIIKLWIEQGVDYKGHWLYIPPNAPDVPAAEEPGFIRNDIDRFILRRLREEGLTPSRRADRVTLIRRLSFDVTGLPPSREQVQAFIRDERPDAYERLVDEMLASAHYGERMAMYWLDLVRFADTVGYHGDRPMDIYPYRDYVIKAFNENMRFDRFTREQLAGDLLPDRTIEQHVASGYNRLNMMSEEGGIQDKEYLAKYASDRVRNLSQTWMGSTVGCAECHDHKFDPFLSKDFYRLAAFFADITEQGFYTGFPNNTWGEKIPVPNAQQRARLDELDKNIETYRDRYEAWSPQLESALVDWQRDYEPTQWSALRLVEAKAEKATLEPGNDGSLLASGGGDVIFDRYTVTYETELEGITAFRLETLTDPSLPNNGPGRGPGGIFAIGEFQVEINGDPIKFRTPTATYEHPALPVAQAVDRNPATSWAIAPQGGKAHTAVFETVDEIGDGGTLRLTVTVNHRQLPRQVLGKFRVSATNAPRPHDANGPPALVLEAMKADRQERTTEQWAALRGFFRASTPLLKDIREKLDGTELEREALIKAVPKTLVSIPREPRVMRILPRGNWMDDSGEIVQPGVPAFLPQIEKDGRATRLDLVNWLMQRDNPFTGRVFMNRLWKLCFGEGLSGNLSDMGSLGEWPSHPELLDYLGLRFADSGWDIKHMFKLIVMSGTYRQSSLARPEIKKKDPFNRLLARQSRFRLDAEMVRDNALTISGLLVRDLYGPSAKPYQPSGYYAYLNFPMRQYEADEGEGLYRRGVYTWWQRQYLHPAMLAFDAPTREEGCFERPRSNTPLQALVLLNDPSYVEAARALAERIMREGGSTTRQRITWAIEEALVRPPNGPELAVLESLYEQHLSALRQDPSAAEQLLSVGRRPKPDDLKLIELAAWASVARAILNLNETITRS